MSRTARLNFKAGVDNAPASAAVWYQNLAMMSQHSGPDLSKLPHCIFRKVLHAWRWGAGLSPVACTYHRCLNIVHMLLVYRTAYQLH